MPHAHDLQSKALPQRSRLKKDLTDKIAENVNGKVGAKTVGNDVEEVGSEGYFTGDRGWNQAAKHVFLGIFKFKILERCSQWVLNKSHDSSLES